ncbi:hypothetical protein ROA7450_00401 [Roseovarius albus]|uniref:Uncharacterized protein n=1 Tax=Roseovarius albus TaxID=1247867 RepID=A0A1X6YBL9_9RHOB|nr:hypothetical protein ROA7450_00401 [Roseovarius albus]
MKLYMILSNCDANKAKMFILCHFVDRLLHAEWDVTSAFGGSKC